MTDATTIRMEMDINRQKLIQSFQVHNEQISQQIQSGIDKAVKEFDFESEIATQCQRLIKEEINSFLWNGSLRTAIKEKISTIVEQLVENQLNKQ